MNERLSAFFQLLEDKNLSRHQLETLRKVICEINRKKYSKNVYIYRGVGCSFSEAVRMRLEDVNLQEGFIRVITAKQKSTITDFSPIPKNLYSLLELYLKKEVKF